MEDTILASFKKMASIYGPESLVTSLALAQVQVFCTVACLGHVSETGNCAVFETVG